MSAEIVPSNEGGLELSKNLPSTPGWAEMSQAEKEGIQQITSMALRGMGTEFAGKLMKEVACYQAEQFLKNTPMSVKDWANMNLGPAWRTIYRAAEKIRDNMKYASDEDLLFLAQRGLHGMPSIHTGHVLNVLHKLPAPKSRSEASREKWAMQIEEAVRGELSQRRKGHKPIALDPDEALVTFILTARRVMREAKLGTSAEQRAWLRRAVGYIMELRAISGSIQAERTAIPDGLIPKRGAPRGPRKKRKKSA
jgi:hypothetical protein